MGLSIESMSDGEFGRGRRRTVPAKAFVMACLCSILLGIPASVHAQVVCRVTDAYLNFGQGIAATKTVEGIGEVVVECQNLVAEVAEVWMALSLAVPGDLQTRLSNGRTTLPLRVGFLEAGAPRAAPRRFLTGHYRERLNLFANQMVVRRIPVFGNLSMSREKSGTFTGNVTLSVSIESL